MVRSEKFYLLKVWNFIFQKRPSNYCMLHVLQTTEYKGVDKKPQPDRFPA